MKEKVRLLEEKFSRKPSHSAVVLEPFSEGWRIEGIELRAEEVVPVLIELLKDMDSRVRTYAAEALGCLGSKATDATLSLERAVSREEKNVREAATKALQKITEEQQIEEKRKRREEEERKRSAEEEQRRKLAAAKQLRKERENTLRKIFNRYEEISIEEMTQLLHFEEELALQRWLLDLPNELAFRVKKDTVIIPQELKDDTTEAEAAINKLIQSFEEFEKKGKGKT